MGLVRRLSLLLRGKANAAVDSLEDPAAALDLAYSKQLEALQQVRRSVADVVTSQKQLEIQTRQMQTNRGKLDDLASRALQQDREDLAAGALTQAELIDGQLSGLRAQIAQLGQQRENLQAVEQRLQARVASMRTGKETLKAQYGAAKATVRAGEAVVGLGKDHEEIQLLLDRTREKMLQTQARAEALTELMQSGALGMDASGVEGIEEQLQTGALPSKVEVRIAELKQDLGLPASPKK